MEPNKVMRLFANCANKQVRKSIELYKVMGLVEAVGSDSYLGRLSCCPE